MADKTESRPIVFGAPTNRAVCRVLPIIRIVVESDDEDEVLEVIDKSEEGEEVEESDELEDVEDEVEKTHEL